MATPIRALAPLLALGTLGSACASAPAASESSRSRTDRSQPRTQPEAVAVDVRGTNPLLPRGLTSFGAAATDDALFVLGGYFGEPHAYSKDGQTGDLLRLDLSSHAWTRIDSIAPSQSLALVAHEGRLVRVGGMQAVNAAGAPADLRSLATVQAFDLATGAWSDLPRLPAPRSSHDAVLLGDTLWVAGGWTLEGEAQTWCDTIASLDLSNAETGWVEEDAPFSRRALAAAAVGDRLVVLGGMDRSGKPTSAVNVFDPARRRWSSAPDFPGMGFGVAATSDGEAIVATGMDGGIHRWRPGDASWQKGSTLAYPRFFHRLVPTAGGGVLVVGGIRGMSSDARVRPIERIPDRAESTDRPDRSVGPDVIALSMPSPLPSKNRQGVAIVEDTLYVFGGNKSLEQHDFGPEFFTDEAAALDLTTMTWRKVAPYPAKRQTMATFVAPWGHIVSIGGFGHDGEVARTHPDVFAYHPDKDTWTRIGSLPGQGRTQFGLAVRDEAVVLFGGLDYDPRRTEADRFRHELDLLAAPLRPREMTFAATKTALPQPRRAFAGALQGDTYYLVGGMREGFDLVETCEAHDFSENTWRTIACPERLRLSAQLVAAGEKLYVAAGSSRGPNGELEPDPSLEVYDPATNTWTMVLDRLPIEPRHVHMLPYRDRLLLFSTHDPEATAHVVLVAPAG